MKTKEEVLARLRKLRTRYLTKYIAQSRERKPCNCVHNYVHNPSINFGGSETKFTDIDLSLRRQTTLVVIQEDRPIGLCMYGSDDASKWQGDICDTDSRAKSCPVFAPRMDVEQAKSEFLEKLADDEYVFNTYRDVATLQWVLGERVHSIPLSLWERFVLWVNSKFWKVERVKALPQVETSSLWSEDDTSSPS